MIEEIIFSNIDIPCCLGTEDCCYCGPNERALRAYASGKCSRNMTEEERLWCIENIIRYSEGSKASDYINETDARLASSVLFSWQDFCRDKGII